MGVIIKRERGQGVSIDKNSEGAWRLSAFVGEGAGEYLLTHTYYFYTKAQAIAQFKQDIKRERVRERGGLGLWARN
jgi:hypothetical protein